jgi:transposase InsO family protein
MCRVYGVTRAGYYSWQHRQPGKRAQANATLRKKIEKIHRDSRGTYGSPRVHRALDGEGCHVSENRVARLMRAHGIRARVATIRYTNPKMQRYYSLIPNCQLDMAITQPDRVWVGDITYLKVGAVYRYLAVVMDKCSRKIVGWSFGQRKDVNLTLAALNHAVRNRRPGCGLIFHTDRGIEYAAGAFKERIAALRFIQSMNRPGKVTDNAFIESFFHSMKSEVFHGYTFTADREVRKTLRRYLPFYNRDRLHSSLNYVSPATYEKLQA